LTVCQSKNNSSGTGRTFEEPINILSRNVDHYQSTLRNIPEDLNSHFIMAEVKSRKTFLAVPAIKAYEGVQVYLQTQILILAISWLGTPLHALSALPGRGGGGRGGTLQK